MAISVNGPRVAPAVSTTTSTQSASATTSADTSGTAARNAALVQSTVQDAIGQLNQNQYTGPDGNAVDLGYMFNDSDLAGIRQPYVDQLNALANANPPLSPDDAKSKADAIVSQFRGDAEALNQGFMDTIKTFIFVSYTTLKGLIDFGDG